jgi:hypothetical protein
MSKDILITISIWKVKGKCDSSILMFTIGNFILLKNNELYIMESQHKYKSYKTAR